MTAETFHVWRCPFDGLITQVEEVGLRNADDVLVTKTTCMRCFCIDGAEGPYVARLDAPTSRAEEADHA